MKTLHAFLMLGGFVRAVERQAVIRSESPGTIYIYDFIDALFGVGAMQVIKELDKISGDVDVRINSPGGDLVEGVAIMNALSRHAANKGRVNVYIDGIAASAATIIALGGHTVTMASNALFMIHNPWTCACGEAADFRALAAILDMSKDNEILPAYERKTGLSRQELSAMMDAETWLTAEDAEAKGFVDAVSDPQAAVVDAAKRYNLSALGKLPKNFPFPACHAKGLDEVLRVSSTHPGAVYYGASPAKLVS